MEYTKAIFNKLFKEKIDYALRVHTGILKNVIDKEEFIFLKGTRNGPYTQYAFYVMGDKHGKYIVKFEEYDGEYMINVYLKGKRFDTDPHWKIILKTTRLENEQMCFSDIHRNYDGLMVDATLLHNIYDEAKRTIADTYNLEINDFKMELSRSAYLKMCGR